MGCEAAIAKLTLKANERPIDDLRDRVERTFHWHELVRAAATFVTLDEMLKCFDSASFGTMA